MNLKKEVFGQSPKGEKIWLYTLVNPNGIAVKVTNYGAIITAIEMADKAGVKENIVLGFNSLEEYLSPEYLAGYPYLGSVCGRYANRIGNAQFVLDGNTYQLSVNHGPHILHGGITGFDKMTWCSKTIEMPDFVGVELKYRSVHLEEGFPGNLDVVILYKLTHKNELIIEYKAVTDKPTVLNLTNHTYFNLTSCREDILGHTLRIDGNKRTITTPDLIPTGEIASVNGTAFDFCTAKKIGPDIAQLPDGYDLNYILDNPTGKLVLAGKLEEEQSGRSVTVYTTEPAIQLYTGYWLPAITTRDGKVLGKYKGVALETQHYADSPNHPDFPTTELRPGQTFKSKTCYFFETSKG